MANDWQPESHGLAPRSDGTEDIPPGKDPWEIWPNDLLYGEVDGRLFFAYKAEVHLLAQLRRAVRESTTWAQFAALAPRDYYEDPRDLLRGIGAQSFEEFQDEMVRRWPSIPDIDVLRQYRTLKVGQRLPLAGDPFDLALVPQFPGRLWPPFPPDYADDWIPKEIFLHYVVRVYDPERDLSYFCFRPAQEAEIVTAFEEHGFPCARNDVLVGRGLGFG